MQIRRVGQGVALALVIGTCAAMAFPRDVCAGASDLGPLEQQALDEALLARGLVRETDPGSKRIGEVHVVNQNVFSRRDGPFQMANFFHRTTREDVIRREALFVPGDSYDPALLEETARNLRDPEFSTLVVVVPVRALLPGQVDVLIVTRDVWSLRFNTDFEYREGRLVYLSASLSENNVLGRRKRAALAFVLNQGAYWAGPTYSDSNISGTRLTFSGAAGGWFSRETNGYEGHSARLGLSYPLYSLASRWGGSVGFSESDSVVRDFLGTQLRREDLAETPEDDALPRSYRLRSLAVSAGAVRSFSSSRVIQRVSFGHRLSDQRPDFIDGFPANPVVRAAFSEIVFPRSERVSALYLSWGFFSPTYRVYRDYDTFDLREDARLGPTASLGVSGAAVPLGSERDFLSVGAEAGYGTDLGDGLQRVSISWAGRLDHGQWIDQSYGAGFSAGTPVLWWALRIVGSAGIGFLKNARPSDLLYAGGGNGLRAYVIGEFRGQAQATGHIEIRSVAVSMGALRTGILGFWDVGHAAATFSQLSPHHDVGLGLRILIPQLNPYVLRFDWAVALQGTPYTPVGVPGRLSLGFRQAF